LILTVKIRPILSDNCYQCHGPDEKARKAKLRLDTKEGAFRVKDGKTVLTPGKSGDSALIRRIYSRDPDEQMPPPKSIHRLADSQKDLIKQWVDEGARWSTQWAFVPPMRRAAAVREKQRLGAQSDRFVRAGQTGRGGIDAITRGGEADADSAC